MAMSKTALSREEFRLEMAYAFGNGLDPIEHLRTLNEAAGWNGRSDDA